ncbi:hypothetical protein CEW81_03510 [Kluyvera genomosp. 3]|uniref:Uncharacterized protein n=1 Tax=Kluyvera genomosp. 3 TaxID=2774055 RepID=A0A248KHG8_9ENTR|nr:hypothetical protein CEW81_03510 [Kluyvera genomosp. 3]
MKHSDQGVGVLVGNFMRVPFTPFAIFSNLRGSKALTFHQRLFSSFERIVMTIAVHATLIYHVALQYVCFLVNLFIFILRRFQVWMYQR